MQRYSGHYAELSRNMFRRGWITIVLIGLAGFVGCAPPTSGSGDAARKMQPYAGVKLQFACVDALVAKEVERRTSAWAARHNAEVQITTKLDSADAVIVRPTELGRLIDTKQAVLLPSALQSSDHPSTWGQCMTVCRERLVSWGGELYGVPLAGEGYAIAYRADRFADPEIRKAYLNKHQRELAAPKTWEEFAEIAEFFADRGQPSLPARATDGPASLREFYFIAACYDRLAASESMLGKSAQNLAVPDATQALSFQHDVETGEPRLSRPAFRDAAAWLKRTARCRGTNANPTQSLVESSAVLAVCSLQELGALTKDSSGAAPPTIGISTLPGTRFWYDGNGVAQEPSDRVKGANFVPYFGAEGWIGVVKSSCTNTDAAFDLLGELLSANRSADLLSEPLLGFGPFRSEQFEQSREAIWSRYGFDAEQTKHLALAVREYASLALANPTFAMRSPDEAKLQSALRQELANLLAGKVDPTASMTAAQAAWKMIDTGNPQAKLWRRKNAGLN